MNNITNIASPFINDPFVLLNQAYHNMSDKPYIAELASVYDYEEVEEIDEDIKSLILFDFEDNIPRILIFKEYTIAEQLESLAYELAQVIAGKDHYRDEVWEQITDELSAEYVKISRRVLGYDYDDSDYTNNVISGNSVLC